MSKIGKINILIPEKVKVVMSGDILNIDGPMGKKSLNIDLDLFNLDIKDGDTLIVLSYADGGFVDLNETDTWTGGSYKSEAVAVQKVGNNYKIGVKETITSGDKSDIVYQVVCADSTGVIDWGKSVWQTP